MRTSLHCLKFVTCALITLPVISVLNLQAQDYLIDFLASGGTKSLTTVKVENLTKGTSLEMDGNDVLHLIGSVTGVESMHDDIEGCISIYPNPMNDYARMRFVLPEPGVTMVSLFDILGKKIFQTRDLLSQGQHTYSVQGVKEGIYIISVSSGRNSFTGRLISSGSQSSNAKIMYKGSVDIVKTEVVPEKQGEVKGIGTETVMNYNTGDRLKFTGISGSYRAVVLDIPSASKTITFEFIPCSDRDGNNYSVVKIGNQIWMAENLRTTTYNNGDSIGTTTPDTLDITNETSPKYQWAYNGDENNVAAYGRLYTWHAVNDSRYICPAGWYVPTDEEWTIMTDYLTNNGFGYEGSGDDIGKSLAASSGWTVSSIPGNVGNDQATNNSSGFSALPGGWHDWEGPFVNMGKSGYWFTSSEYDDINAWYRGMYFNKLGITKGPVGKIAGLSVRCVRDQSKAIPEAFPGIAGEHQVYIIGGDTLHVKKIDDKYVWEGDIILTEEQLTSGEGKGAGINSSIRRWFCTVYFKINSDVEFRRKSILAAIDHVESSTSVDFMELTDPETNIKNYVEFIWDDNTCASNLGMTIGKQYIWVPNWAERGDIIHEIGHTIGLIHEHSRSDRDDYVKVLYNNIQPDPEDPDLVKNNFDKISTRYISSGFDFESNMLYDSYAFSKGEPNYPTILRKEGGYLYPSRNSLTPSDIELINEIYKPDTVKDIDGNIYSTITIGKQIWMKENLRTTRYNDGGSIPLFPFYLGYLEVDDVTIPFRWVGDYGGIYNYYTVSTGKLCPKGWHVPTLEEFEWLIDTLGGEEIAGVPLKEVGIVHWQDPNYATNETCFTALPECSIMPSGYIVDSGVNGLFWTSTVSDYIDETYGETYGRAAYQLRMRFNWAGAYFVYFAKSYLDSVRCIKDQPAP